MGSGFAKTNKLATLAGTSLYTPDTTDAPATDTDTDIPDPDADAGILKDLEAADE